MMSNPNTNAGAIGGALGVLVSWLLGHYKVALSAEDGAAISTGLAALVLYIGRDGLRGVFRNLWRGRQQPPPPPPPQA
jgi:hypothetical protein